jgi:hypothetical protein
MNLTCSGKVAANVHRECPVVRTMCSVVNVADSSIVTNDYCQADVVGSSVYCRCGGNGESANANVSRAILALGGKVTVAAFRSFAVGEIDSSFSTAAIPVVSADSLAQQSVIIFVFFGSVWGCTMIVVGLVLGCWKYRKLSRVEQSRRAGSATTTNSSKSVIR